MQQIKNKRVTIIKHLVGKVRSPGYSLPGDQDDSFAYGIRNKPDEEGAGKVIQSWVEETAPTKQTEVKCFPATHRLALKHGCLTSKSQGEFASKKPIMKVLCKPHQCSNNNIRNKRKSCLDPTVYDHDRVFGIKNVENDVSIKDLLKSDYVEEKDYPNLSQRQKKGRLPPSRLTKASKLLEATIKSRSQNKEMHHNEMFKMKKFLRVESKVKAMLQV